MKLTDTQLVILQSGARDPDRICQANAKLGAAPRGAMARKLIALGLAEATPAPSDAPAERRFPSSDKAGAAPMLLRITDAGLRAIGVEPEEEPIPPYESGEERAMQRAAILKRQLAEETRGDAPEAQVEAPTKARRRKRQAETDPARSAEAPAPRSGRRFWRVTEEAAARGDLLPAPDLSAPTHTPYRRKLERLLALAQAGDASGLRAVAINPISTTPKVLARWRGLAVRAIEAREARR